MNDATIDVSAPTPPRDAAAVAGLLELVSHHTRIGIFARNAGDIDGMRRSFARAVEYDRAICELAATR